MQILICALCNFNFEHRPEFSPGVSGKFHMRTQARVVQIQSARNLRHAMPTKLSSSFTKEKFRIGPSVVQKHVLLHVIELDPQAVKYSGRFDRGAVSK